MDIEYDHVMYYIKIINYLVFNSASIEMLIRFPTMMVMSSGGTAGDVNVISSMMMSSSS
jgi:hypothetical protein